MSRGVLVAVSAAILIATSLASPARAGGWQYDPAADLILYDSVPVAPWYRQRPWIGTGPGHYYSYYPHHVPSYPDRLTGYPVPIYKAHRPLPVPVIRPIAHRPPRMWNGAPSATDPTTSAPRLISHMKDRAGFAGRRFGEIAAGGLLRMKRNPAPVQNSGARLSRCSYTPGSHQKGKVKMMTPPLAYDASILSQRAG